MLLDLSCARCGGSGAPVCPGCRADLRPAPGLAVPLGLDGWSALLRYDDAARAVLTSLKNGQRRDVVAWLADEVVRALPAPVGATLTWAPTGPSRRRTRGFDQAELLSRALARRWQLPCQALLRRLPGPPQAGLGGSQRRVAPRFAARSSARLAPRLVVVVDDVATTGSTLVAAARALREAGSTEVRAVVAARAHRRPIGG